MRRLIILHVEDKRPDALLLSEACRAAGLPADFYEVSGGADAVAYLEGDGVFADCSAGPAGRVRRTEWGEYLMEFVLISPSPLN